MAPAATDPLEQLRQRLAARLSGQAALEVPNPHELRVVGRAALTPAVVAPTRAAKPVAARAVAAAGNSQAAWAYQGAAGPQTWGGLKPEFNLCGNGQRQSPIDIRGGLAVDLDPINFDYQAARFGVIDNGYTVQANIAPGSSIELGGKRFELVQFHFHRPSEERIDGRQFEMSLHLVHKDAQGRLAVVAVLLDKGPPQPAVQRVWNNLPLEKGEDLAARLPLDLAALLPTDRRYFTYMGSMTTPPCSEGVQWVVMRQPVTMSLEQIELFARIYPMNARPLQQAAGRRILQSQ
ncbi:MAG: carbonic anhydrase family protein [Rubrivivax sp.]|nr:carbonic anhydrase family protein [Rubrivivax sp.]